MLERGILMLGLHGCSYTGNDRFTDVNFDMRIAGLGRLLPTNSAGRAADLDHIVDLQPGRRDS